MRSRRSARLEVSSAAVLAHLGPWRPRPPYGLAWAWEVVMTWAVIGVGVLGVAALAGIIWVIRLAGADRDADDSGYGGS
jgi:hypothetical protein